MKHIKAKFLKDEKPVGRAYTYKTSDDVIPGDIVLNEKGSKLQVVDETVDEEWIAVYGTDKIATVCKCKEE